MVAKMPLLMSSRMTSAGLTDSSSARSLTVIVAGRSTAPRSRGSATETAAPANAASRRGGLRGPRRPRVPLLLLANESSRGRCDGRGGHRGRQLGGEGGGNGADEGPRQQAAPGGAGDARRVTADVRAAPGHATGRVEAHRSVRRADDPEQVALGACRATGDARPERWTTERALARAGAYDDTSSEVALA